MFYSGQLLDVATRRFASHPHTVRIAYNLNNSTFWRSWVHITVRKQPASLADEVVRCFTQSLQTNAGIVPWNRPRLVHSTFSASRRLQIIPSYEHVILTLELFLNKWKNGQINRLIVAVIQKLITRLLKGSVSWYLFVGVCAPLNSSCDRHLGDLYFMCTEW